MKFLRILGWIAFAAAILVMARLQYAPSLGNGRLNIMELEFAGSYKGCVLLKQWSVAQTVSGNTLLALADTATRWDFLFILGYVMVIIAESYQQMQQEPRARLNGLLRASFAIAVIAGLLDAVQNFILLGNMQPWKVGRQFCTVWWIAAPKFAAAAWCVLVWLTSLLTAKNVRRRLFPG